VRLTERFEQVRPLDEMEIKLVRESLADPRLVDAHEEAVVRTALSLARLTRVRQGGKDVGVSAWLDPFREELVRKLEPVILAPRKIDRALLMPHLRELEERTVATRDGLVRRFESRLSAETIDREIRHKALVMVSGGGGGSAYVYAGVMSLLADYGLTPSLLVGTSMGAILSLFRSRVSRFEQDEIVSIVRSLSWRKLFRLISTENRFGVPAAMRLFLRAGIGRWFGAEAPGAQAVTLRELPIPTIITVSGIRRGKLPHPLEFYEKLLHVSRRTLLSPWTLALSLSRAFGALQELVTTPDLLVKLHLGADEATLDFDALDAAGFSSALPGVIHYDVLRDDARMQKVLEGVCETHGISRLVDGGLVDNLPCRAAWKAVHQGKVGTRNALIVGLNGFAMKLRQPLWLPIERLAEVNVAKNRRWAHLVHDFTKTLSPLELVPGVETFARAIALGREALASDMPLIARLLAPLPRLHGPA